MKTAFYIIMVSLLILLSCNGQERRKDHQEPEITDQDREQMRESLINNNRRMMLAEMEMIDAYIREHKLDMDTTARGVRIKITKEGKGIKPEMMSMVSLDYTIHNLKDEYTYSSDSSGVLEFRLGKSDEPSGLQEALLHMKEGDEALVIIPSFLAYGITGDGNKIGSSETLIYNIRLKRVILP